MHSRIMLCDHLVHLEIEQGQGFSTVVLPDYSLTDHTHLAFGLTLRARRVGNRLGFIWQCVQPDEPYQPVQR